MTHENPMYNRKRNAVSISSVEKCEESRRREGMRRDQMTKFETRTSETFLC